MSEALTHDELALLDEAMLDSIEPVEPPAAIRARVLSAIMPGKTIRNAAGEQDWRPTPAPGVEFKKLHADRTRNTVTFLLRFAPGAVLPGHPHHGPEDTYVISGSCHVGPVGLTQGDYHHVEAGERHGTIVSDEGCVLLLTVDRADWEAA